MSKPFTNLHAKPDRTQTVRDRLLQLNDEIGELRIDLASRQAERDRLLALALDDNGDRLIVDLDTGNLAGAAAETDLPSPAELRQQYDRPSFGSELADPMDDPDAFDSFDQLS